MQTCSAHIQQQVEIFILPFSNQLLATVSGISEGRYRVLGRKRRLEQHQFFEFYTFAHGRDVVDDSRGKFFSFKPEAGKSMSLGEHQDGVKTCLFYCCTEEQR
ncbi:hypothetical protein D3C71_1965950 [compost metagenome]